MVKILLTRNKIRELSFFVTERFTTTTPRPSSSLFRAAYTIRFESRGPSDRLVFFDLRVLGDVIIDGGIVQF